MSLDNSFDDSPEDHSGSGGGAGWVMTFADLMSLLMTFFVLLLSFSEMDVLRFKRLSGSMKNAFGVQSHLQVTQVPKGTSIIANEFAPGRPDTTPVHEIWQRTSDDSESSLEVSCQDTGNSNSGESGDAQKLVVFNRLKELIGETEQDGLAISAALAEEIANGTIEVSTEGRKILIRMRESGVFGSGSAALRPDFMPVLRALRDALAETPGQIEVQGHTDDVPIHSARFPSNWALSAARAVSVAHGLMSDPRLPEKRFQIAAYGDTRPIESNATAEGRAKNRRVEIVIEQGLTDDVEKDLRELQRIDPAGYREVEEAVGVRFDLRPEEIF